MPIFHTMQQLIEQAVQLLKRGELVAFPTETVYGLGADARNPEAVAKVFAAKGRPANHPLIVHIADYTQLEAWARDVPVAAHQLAQAFWPGPLTMVLAKQPDVLPAVTGGQATVAIRMPRHQLALRLLQAFGSGLVAPSANRFTRISPTTAAAVQTELGDALSLILDGGACEVGLESTIIDLSQAQPRLLRPGMIAVAAIEEVLGQTVAQLAPAQPVAVIAPGMHPVHYAPTTETLLVSTDRLTEVLRQCRASERIAIMSYSGFRVAKNASHLHAVAMPDEPNAYAQVLYDTLRRLDEAGYKQIIIEDVPQQPKWLAIADRILKASGSKRLT